ncbi:hypothetical protein pipiens_000322, partial [Culex pipiens pipiens]
MAVVDDKKEKKTRNASPDVLKLRIPSIANSPIPRGSPFSDCSYNINERENMVKAGVGNMSRLNRRSVPLGHDYEKAAIVLKETKVDFNKNISRAVQELSGRQLVSPVQQ